MKLILSFLFFGLQSKNVLMLNIPDPTVMNVGKIVFQVQQFSFSTGGAPSVSGHGHSVALSNAAQVKGSSTSPGQSNATFLLMSQCNVGGVGLIPGWNSADGAVMCWKGSVCTGGWG